jgi:hypothetical protein
MRVRTLAASALLLLLACSSRAPTPPPKPPFQELPTAGTGPLHVASTFDGVGAPAITKVCQKSDDCNALADGGVPACTSPSGAYCLCQQSSTTSSTTCSGGGGRCVFAVNVSKKECVCVPGVTELCPGSSPYKVRTCNANGTGWDACH